LDIEEELCACFTDWQKALDSVNRTKLIKILKVTGIDWCERRLISKLYVDQSIKLKLDQGGDRKRETGRGVRQVCCLSSIIFNWCNKYLTSEALEGFRDFRIGGQVIRTVKCADDLVLLAEEEPVLQGMLEKLIEFSRCMYISGSRRFSTLSDT
jgi:hypothetical protein